MERLEKWCHTELVSLRRLRTASIWIPGQAQNDTKIELLRLPLNLIFN